MPYLYFKSGQRISQVI